MNKRKDLWYSKVDKYAYKCSVLVQNKPFHVSLANKVTVTDTADCTVCWYRGGVSRWPWPCLVFEVKIECVNTLIKEWSIAKERWLFAVIEVFIICFEHLYISWNTVLWRSTQLNFNFGNEKIFTHASLAWPVSQRAVSINSRNGLENPPDHLRFEKILRNLAQLECN